LLDPNEYQNLALPQLAEGFKIVHYQTREEAKRKLAKKVAKAYQDLVGDQALSTDSQYVL